MNNNMKSLCLLLTISHDIKITFTIQKNPVNNSATLTTPSYLCTQVSRAENMLNSARHKQLLKLRRKGRSSMGDMEISKHKD